MVMLNIWMASILEREQIQRALNPAFLYVCMKSITRGEATLTHPDAQAPGYKNVLQAIRPYPNVCAPPCDNRVHQAPNSVFSQGHDLSSTALVSGASIRSVPVESNQAWPVAALLHASIALTFGHWLFENNLNYYYLITWSATSKLRSISSCFLLNLKRSSDLLIALYGME